MMAKQRQRQRKAEAPIIINIEPQPLPDAPAYVINREMTQTERATLQLAWHSMNREAGTKRYLFVLPEGVELKELHTEHLKQLRKGIDEVLKERGADDEG